MRIDADTVKQVAKLANLSLSPEEVSYYETHLAKIVGYIDQLSELKDDDSGEVATTKIASTPERADEVRVSDVLTEALQQAPAHIGTAFQVPRIIE